MRLINLKYFTSLCFVTGSVLFSVNALAGNGWFITIINDSPNPVTITGKGATGGNQCWDSYDLDKVTTIGINTAKTIYTEQLKGGACAFKPSWQNFLLGKERYLISDTNSFDDHNVSLENLQTTAKTENCRKVTITVTKAGYSIPRCS